MEARSCTFNALSQVWYLLYAFLVTENSCWAYVTVAVVVRYMMDRIGPRLAGGG